MVFRETILFFFFMFKASTYAAGPSFVLFFVIQHAMEHRVIELLKVEAVYTPKCDATKEED